MTSVGYVGTIDDTRSFEWLSSRYPDSFQMKQDDLRTSCLGQKGFWLELDNGKRMEFLFTDPHRDAELGADLLVGALESKLEIGPGVDLSRRR